METLAERLQFIMSEQGVTQQKLADMIGITQQSVNKIVKGETRQPKNIVEIANVLGVDVQWLKTGKGQEPDFEALANREPEEEAIRIEVLDIEVSAGHGSYLSSDFMEVVSAIEYAPMSFHQLFNGYNPEFISLVNVKGDSMSPTFESGDLLFVDTSINHYNGDGVYVFSYGDTLHVKRLQMAGDELLVISDNPAYRDWSINHENEYKFHIKARVLLSQSQQFKRFG